MAASGISSRVVLNGCRPGRQPVCRVVCQAAKRTDAPGQVSRRSALLASGILLVGAADLPAWAGRPPIPKAYPGFVDDLSTELIETIELEASGAGEAEVRRKADKAKDLVREFVLSWRGDIRVSGEKSYGEIKDALTELGDFYAKNGQRTKLPEDLAEDVVGHLKAAKEAAKAT